MRWETVQAHGYIFVEESRPFEPCPHCHMFDFRRVRKAREAGGLLSWLFGGEEEVLIDRWECQNCGYREDVDD